MELLYTNQNIQYYQNSCCNFMNSDIWVWKKTFRSNQCFAVQKGKKLTISKKEWNKL